jgi:hypothetical protein
VDRRRANPAVLVAIAIVHLVVTTLTWRDIRHRPDGQIRGKKTWWRAASALNTANSFLYFVVGRRRNTT